ncbi:MAG: hypothetical protein K6E75_01880 [Lachnospiraceae bacterium]|nr:hypothetical protein [Lachnospiraceae bacterium]
MKESENINQPLEDNIDRNILNEHDFVKDYDMLSEKEKMARVNAYLLSIAKTRANYPGDPDSFIARINHVDTQHFVKDAVNAIPDGKELIDFLDAHKEQVGDLAFGKLGFIMSDEDWEKGCAQLYSEHKNLKPIMENNVLREVYFENTSREAVLGECTRRLAEVSASPSTAPVVGEEMARDMAELVLLDSLSNRINGKDGGLLGNRKDGKVESLSEMNRKLASHRERIMNDPVFTGCLREGVTRDKFVSVYKAARKAQMESDTDLATYADTVTNLDDRVVKLSKEQKEAFKDLEKQLIAANEGKNRKGLNADMLNALKEVNEKASSALTFADLNKLKMAAAQYYTNRKGRFFNPVTDAGKDRLDIAGRIFDESRNAINLVYDDEAKMKRQQRVNEALAAEKALKEKVSREALMNIAVDMKDEHKKMLGLSDEEIKKVQEKEAQLRHKKDSQEDVIKSKPVVKKRKPAKPDAFAGEKGKNEKNVKGPGMGGPKK